MLAGHPKTGYLPEMAIVGPVNRWLGELFDPDNLDRTVAALVASQGGDPRRTAASKTPRLGFGASRRRSPLASILPQLSTP
jgi:hypothetical protein